MVNIKKGDIIIADLEPVKGHEQGGIRPCLIIQNDLGNKFSPTTIISAITSKRFLKKYPTNIEISKNESKLEKDSTVMLNQIRTIDKSRIIKVVSSLDKETMKGVDLALKRSLELN
ncbi:PemK family transcriptional regulator [Candidatus Pacearchaeota archaeon CG10_big_fil_rev_8_21_14_0_10_34_76]|nr:MAG: PemK family transcriptional regulator [Candidatus Pacearchaeota archaeon CG10_big_fil_rev_8_21_14_0_10_34_76]